jgi:hypothetical protein
MRTKTSLCILSVAGAVFCLSVPNTAMADAKAVKSLAAKKVAIVSRLHKKASKALVNFAQDKVFGQYYGGDKSVKAAIEKLELRVQSKFHVEEMCLIGENGHEVSRIVADMIAPDSDLSTEEASAPFFKPGFAMAAKKVYISPAYMSPDADKWVVAYVTPIVAGGKKPAILHYEHGLDVYQAALGKGVKDGTYVLAVDVDGFVVSDSRNPPAIAKIGKTEERADYFTKHGDAIAGTVRLGKTGQGEFSEGGANYLVAYKPVEDWTIIAVEKQ